MKARTLGGIALYEFDVFTPHQAALQAGCTGRSGGVSEPPYDKLNLGLHVGDDQTAVLENRQRLAGALDVELASFVIPAQIHAGEVKAVGAADRGRGVFSVEDAIPGADALVTGEAGVVLAVMLADCVPVIIFDPHRAAVGIAHAGWRGTVHHVTRNTVEAMQREFASDPGTLQAGVGPSVGPNSYEVGSEVAERARVEFPGAQVVRPHSGESRQAGERQAGRRQAGRRHTGEMQTGEMQTDEKYLFDLWSANFADLTSAGVPPANIEVAGFDTYQMTADFFSHRRQRPTGRFLAYATLRQ